MYEITKAFHFSASHRLTGLEPGHKCLRLHGHNYTVTINLAAAGLDDTAMVLDYAALKPFGKWIDDNFDHRHLGVGAVYDESGSLTDPAIMAFNPTAEHLAAWFLTKAQQLYPGLVRWVEVKETDGTSAKALT